MKINDNYRLVYDENNVILEHHENKIRQGGKNEGEQYISVEHAKKILKQPKLTEKNLMTKTTSD